MSKRTIILIVSLSVVIILLSPFIVHKISFDLRYKSHRERWDRLSRGNYEAIVLSNSLDYPTGGENRIVVREGKIIEGFNPGCVSCSLEEYGPLTIEALFDRIYKECIHMTLLPICNVVYDESFGYPRRIDTYTFSEEGIHSPSITISEVWITNEE